MTFEPLLKFLAHVGIKGGFAEHTFVVGGAPRNYLLGEPIKDLDLVVDSLTLGRNSNEIAREIQRSIATQSSLVTNRYGVYILSIAAGWELEGHRMRPVVLEIATAVCPHGGKGCKSHFTAPASIATDLSRRDFTVNSLLWRLADLGNGLDRAPVLDLLGSGLGDLEARVLRTPLDPDRTFTDDPTRMLRAIKFAVRYGFSISLGTSDSIRRNGMKLAEMPWDAVRKLLVDDLLQGPAPEQAFQALHELGLNQVIVGLMETTQGFQRGLSRPFAEMDIRLALLAIHSGWPLSPSPVSFFTQEQSARLKQLMGNPDARDHERTWDPDRLWAAIKQPPIDQPKLFERHNLQGAARQRVAAKARELLLLDPTLSDDPARLEVAVELALGGAP